MMGCKHGPLLQPSFAGGFSCQWDSSAPLPTGRVLSRPLNLGWFCAQKNVMKAALLIQNLSFRTLHIPAPVHGKPMAAM